MTPEEREWIQRETERIAKAAEERRYWDALAREVANATPRCPFPITPLSPNVSLQAIDSAMVSMGWEPILRQPDEPLVTPSVASYLAEWFER